MRALKIADPPPKTKEDPEALLQLFFLAFFSAFVVAAFSASEKRMSRGKFSERY
jgi:hypothetical protein